MKKPEITNNHAEYIVIIFALKKYVDSDKEIIIYGNSKNTINPLNHEFTINNKHLGNLAREAMGDNCKILYRFNDLGSSKRESGWKNAWNLKTTQEMFSRITLLYKIFLQT